MTTADDVRRVGLALPRAYERLVGRRWKLKVKQIVFVSFSEDETRMGFGYPREERDDLIASAPDVFFLPQPSDLRYQWVSCHLDRLADDEMTELVVDAWRMCVPQMLHALPDLPAPGARVWHLVEQQDWAEVRPLLHPYVRFTDGRAEVRGRNQVLAHLRCHPTPRPPKTVEVVDGQVRRWQ